LKRLKKSRCRAIVQPKHDTDVDLSVDVQRLSSWGAERPTFSRRAPTDGQANDWRVSRENETESTSFESNSLGRREYLQTGNKFADHCSASGHIVASSQLSTGAT